MLFSGKVLQAALEEPAPHGTRLRLRLSKPGRHRPPTAGLGADSYSLTPIVPPRQGVVGAGSWRSISPHHREPVFTFLRWAGISSRVNRLRGASISAKRVCVVATSWDPPERFANAAILWIRENHRDRTVS